MKHPRIPTAALVALSLLPLPEVRYRRTKSERRVRVGRFEVAVQPQWIDLCLGGKAGTVLAGRFAINGRERAYRYVEEHRHDTKATCHIVFNRRGWLGMLGLLGQNIAEARVGDWGYVLTWVENDLRRMPEPPPHVTDPYTAERRLCDDEGMVSTEPVADPPEFGPPGLTYLDRHNAMRMSMGKPMWAEPFACTGSAHLVGEHFRCTSPAHVPVAAR